MERAGMLKSLHHPNASMRIGSNEIVEEEKSMDGTLSSKNTASRFTTFEVLPTLHPGKAATTQKSPLNLATPLIKEPTSPSFKGKLGLS